jgi:hypothetical protein
MYSITRVQTAQRRMRVATVLNVFPASMPAHRFLPSEACPVGTYQPAVSAFTACVACAVNTSLSASGSSSCEDCSAGRYGYNCTQDTSVITAIGTASVAASSSSGSASVLAQPGTSAWPLFGLTSAGAAAVLAVIAVVVVAAVAGVCVLYRRARQPPVGISGGMASAAVDPVEDGRVNDADVDSQTDLLDIDIDQSPHVELVTRT